MFNFKTRDIWRLAGVVLAVLGAVVLGFALCTFTGQQNTKADTISNQMLLGTSIAGATVNFRAGSNTAEYNGQSQYPIVQSVTIGTDEVEANDTNFVLTYKRNGEVTEDLSSVGQIDITITGQGDYEGSIDTSFTITKKDVKIDFSFDQSVANDNVAYEFNGAFVTDTSNNGLSGNFGMIITYYNKTIEQFTEGFVQAGDYVVNVNITNPGYNVIGSTSVGLYVRPVVLSNADGSVKVKNAKGFAKGITLGEASLTTNEYAISSRSDISAQIKNAAVMINLALLKNGEAYASTDDLQIIAKIGDLQFDKLVLYTNNGNTTKFEKAEYTQNGDTVVIDAKTNEDGKVLLGTYVMAADAPVNVLGFVLLGFTVLTLISLGVISISLLRANRLK